MAVGQDPSGDLGLFLNLFLPLLTRASCQERQGKQWEEMRNPNTDNLISLLFRGAHCTKTPKTRGQAIYKDYLPEASALPCKEGLLSPFY